MAVQKAELAADLAETLVQQAKNILFSKTAWNSFDMYDMNT